MALAVSLHEPQLCDPVELVCEGLRIVLEALEHRFPAIQHAACRRRRRPERRAALGGVLAGEVVELPLQLRPAVKVSPEASSMVVRSVVFTRDDRIAATGAPTESRLAEEAVLDHRPARSRWCPPLRRWLPRRGWRHRLSHAAAGTLRIGVGFVAGVDDRSLECRLETDLLFEEVRPLAQLELRHVAPVGDLLADLAGSGIDLSRTRGARSAHGRSWRTGGALSSR